MVTSVLGLVVAVLVGQHRLPGLLLAAQVQQVLLLLRSSTNEHWAESKQRRLRSDTSWRDGLHYD
jgi:hypothetical protein